MSAATLEEAAAAVVVDGATLEEAAAAGAATAASVGEPARQPAADLGFGRAVSARGSCTTSTRPIISANVAPAREFASRATAESSVA